MKTIFQKLSDEFESMEKTIAFQKKMLADASSRPVCPCWKVPENGQIYAVPELPKLKLNDCTWYEIAMYAQSGMADKVFALGDTKKITLATGTEINLRIIGFNHDNSDTGDRLPISFESVETLPEDMVMNDKPTNVGGWEKSKLRSVLNENFFNVLPEDLKAVIKPCAKMTRTSGREDAPLGKTVDKLFVLSEQEVFGRKIYSGGAEGHWYDWYRQENIEYGKRKPDGERDWRWERSPRSGDATTFCHVSSSGGANGSGASGARGVSFGFCV